MNQQTLDQIHAMVDFSAAVGELVKERDELLNVATKLTAHVMNGGTLDGISAKDYAAVRPAMIAIARARGKSTFGNDWWGALE